MIGDYRLFAQSIRYQRNCSISISHFPKILISYVRTDFGFSASKYIFSVCFLLENKNIFEVLCYLKKNMYGIYPRDRHICVFFKCENTKHDEEDLVSNQIFSSYEKILKITVLVVRVINILKKRKNAEDFCERY